jgi:shikimate dehydrogenase
MNKHTYAVIGWPLGHSLSPVIQQAAFDASHLDATYVAIPTPPGDEQLRFDEVRKGELSGLNVTIPHKHSAFHAMDSHTAAASKLGAVNTVIRDNGKLWGDNTDLQGFVESLRTFGQFDPAGANTVVLGAGGSARAVVHALADSQPRSIVVANRTLRRAQALASSVAGPVGPKIHASTLDANQLEDQLAKSTLLVNTTSVGMVGGPEPDKSPINPVWLHEGLLVFDIVYRPTITPLLHAAGIKGAKTLGGLEMLVLQGAASFKQWTGEDPSLDAMFDAGRAALSSNRPTGAL